MAICACYSSSGSVSVGRGRRISRTFWLSDELQGQRKTMSRGNKVISDKEGTGHLPLASHTSVNITHTHTPHTNIHACKINTTTTTTIIKSGKD